MLSDCCLSVLSVCPILSVRDVGVFLWPNGWMDQDVTGMAVGLGPGHIVLHGDPAPPPKKKAAPIRPMSVVAKRLGGL